MSQSGLLKHSVSFELAGHNLKHSEDMERCFQASIAHGWHTRLAPHGSRRGMAGWADAPQPSTRAAVVLSAAGVPLTAEG